MKQITTDKRLQRKLWRALWKHILFFTLVFWLIWEGIILVLQYNISFAQDIYNDIFFGVVGDLKVTGAVEKTQYGYQGYQEFDLGTIQVIGYEQIQMILGLIVYLFTLIIFLLIDYHRLMKKVLEESSRQVKEAEGKKHDMILYLAHDLKTPLTSVIGYLTLLEESGKLPEEQRQKYIQIAMDKSYRLEELIDEFFEMATYSGKEIALEEKEVRLVLMLQQIVDEFYPVLLEKKLECRIHAEGEIAFYADADKMMRLFDNLLKNAVNYSYADSVIDITVKRKQKEVEIIFENACDEIPKDKLERIFEKFYRVDTARSTKQGGTGLGLAIAKNIAELYQGSIHAESEAQIMRVIVVLPLKK